MVAAGASMLVRVNLRKGRRLYINDGTYGSLFDAGALNWRYPVRLVRPLVKVGKNSKDPNSRVPSEKAVQFSFYGPTCDNLDKMQGPFLLPEDTQEGDWIEIGMMGAYGAAMKTWFNGFHASLAATVWPEAPSFIFDRASRHRSPAAELKKGAAAAPNPNSESSPVPLKSAL